MDGGTIIGWRQLGHENGGAIEGWKRAIGRVNDHENSGTGPQEGQTTMGIVVQGCVEGERLLEKKQQWEQWCRAARRKNDYGNTNVGP